MMDSFSSNHLEQARSNSVYDLQQLDDLRQRGLNNDESALRAAAEQFEALFMNMLMKGMRAANKVFEDGENPFSSRDVEFFQDMHDNQLTSELSQQGTLGLAELMVQQLSPTGTADHTPSDLLPAQRFNGSSHQTAHSQSDEAVPYQDARGTQDELAAANNRRSDNMVLADRADWRPGNPIEFLETLAPYAKQVSEEAGIAPESVLAQAALETGWGRHVVADDNGSSNNLFNIKADNRWDGDRAQTMTTEYYNGQPQRESAFFRSYQSVADSFHDYVDFLQTNPRYQRALEVGQDAGQFVEELQQAGYATDPSYARKLQTIMQSDVMQNVREKFGF
ncbi:flagellar assembly peptidoglycan hydrolase FlgJ [Aliidiomarina sedimenti]|nr:flagellar assembly peptidoglycan hydrolase FlgJ [Aliidiomarina sedimenti]